MRGTLFYTCDGQDQIVLDGCELVTELDFFNESGCHTFRKQGRIALELSGGKTLVSFVDRTIQFMGKTPDGRDGTPIKVKASFKIDQKQP